MSVAITDGPLGVEGIHTLHSVVMNLQGVLPIIELREVTGLHDAGDSDDPRDPATGRIGEIPYRALLRGKNVTYNGRIAALTLPALRATASSLRAAASRRDDTSIRIDPHPDWGTVPLWIFGRPIAYTSPDSQAKGPSALPTPYQRDFVLTFRMRDPRAWALDNAVSAGASGGVADTITPGGTAPTEPTFVIQGPTSGTIVLRHVTTGLNLTLPGVTLASGEELLVDFGGTTTRRSITKGGDDMSGYIDWSASTWWDEDAFGLAPGAQSIRVDGCASWTASAYPAVF